ncbi:MAG: Aminopeptidase YwaD precursor [Lentisphaerae bacterium ADurb.Bin242]|nr:MAG: Aminopeptidase YwaD precursor [Lentisphaerae bacterium ADurb.Bin242]
MRNASEQELCRHVEMLCNQIGVRLAGSPQEREAAQYIHREGLKYTERCWIEEFPVMERCVESEILEVFQDGVWKKYPCSLFGSSPTTEGKTLEGELVLFDSHTDYQRDDLSGLKGKAVIHLGCHIDSAEKYGKLMKAEPAFLLFVDTRYPGNVPLADGLFPAYVAAMGAKPTVNVAYMDAWNWCTGKAEKARLTVSGSTKQSLSTNVVIELPGTDPDAGILFAGGHHDTQAGTVGADDNAIGSAAVIELARIFSERPHRRTFRLISFGAEEQLSVGSASYVRKHRAELEAKGVFMCNFDSFGSSLGWTVLNVNSMPPMLELIRKAFRENGIFFKEGSDVIPFTDQFPFAVAGIPGIWISRPNCEAGMFYHHRADNTPDKIGYTAAARHIDAAAEMLSVLADAEDISPFRGIPPETAKRVAEEWREVFGGWWSPQP